MKRADFQEISVLRVREARVLLDASHYAGAYYLMGYALECAFKACIAKQFQRHDLPDRKFVADTYTHSLGRLLRLAGLEAALDTDMKTDPHLQVNWTVVKDWSETSRYDIGITEQDARDLYSACTARRHGVLPWIRRRW